VFVIENSCKYRLRLGSKLSIPYFSFCFKTVTPENNMYNGLYKLRTAMQVISFSQARSQFKGVIDRVVSDRDATLIHRRDGENAVLLSEASYNSMMETLYLLASPANAKRLMQSVAQDRQGKARARKLLDA